ncbi:MAG: aminotransferase class I/II-fold pyridoxal phosphate-dependent enzyme [Myxococcota bacterium]
MESQRVAAFGTTVFAEFSRLAAQHGAVNLGQGFPDFDGPDEVKAAAIDAIRGGVNQYAISTGAVALRQAIAAHAWRFYGQVVDPDSQVVVTSGCTEAIFDAVMALVDPGDEVVLFEPFYDSYLASVQMAGGVPRFVELRAPDAQHPAWWFEERELAAAFSARTRLVFLNTPHNPTGKVFTREEIELIGALAKKHGAVLVSDEVYEHLVFAPARHVRPATLPGLADLTLTLSSGGKSFSFTGWKIGWALGPAPLVKAVQKAHQWVTFATASPFQAAIAKALALPDAYFEGFVRDYQAKRDRLSSALKAGGLEPLTCEGTYFLMARTDKHRKAGEDDVAFCRRLVTEEGVAAIPPSVFYSAAHAPSAHGLARFAFCKTDAVLDAAATRLARGAK